MKYKYFPLHPMKQKPHSTKNLNILYVYNGEIWNYKSIRTNGLRGYCDNVLFAEDLAKRLSLSIFLMTIVSIRKAIEPAKIRK